MSNTYINTKTKNRLWLMAGGRCEYRGCNDPLWRDNLTMAEMNKAYVAHIVADSPDGPRGDRERSKLLATELSNLMLLCDAHHRLIDTTDVKGHPEELLLHFKHEHEERIELLTGLGTEQKSHLVRLTTNFGTRKGVIELAEAHRAMLPRKYPAEASGIHIELTQLSMSDSADTFWTVMKGELQAQVRQRVAERIATSDTKHLSVFAIASMPLLVYFGYLLGDVGPADVYQKSRTLRGWSWAEEDEGIDFEIIPHNIRPEDEVEQAAIILSISDAIPKALVEARLPENCALYELKSTQPHFEVFSTKKSIERFLARCKELLVTIRERHGGKLTHHLFPAMPIAGCIELGRMLLPKSGGEYIIYDLNENKGGFQKTLSINTRPQKEDAKSEPGEAI